MKDDIEDAFAMIGIEAELIFMSWTAVSSRVIDQEVGAYVDGGYDIVYFSMSMGTSATHQGDNINRIFGANFIPPYGFNVMYWNEDASKGYNDYRANESEVLIQSINTNCNLTEATADFIEWQKVWYDSMPMCVIFNQYEVHAVSKGLYGYDPNKFPVNSLEDVWLTNDYTGLADTVVLAASTGATTLNSLITTDRYSSYANSPVMDSLYGLTPSKEVLLPAGTDRAQWMLDTYGIAKRYHPYPRMAAAIGNYTTTGSKANLEYNVSVRDDVLWHDGHVFDAWDVAFTFQAVLTPTLIITDNEHDRKDYKKFINFFGVDDPINHHGNYSFIVEDKNGDGYDEHISFQLNRTSGIFEFFYVGGYPILPEHILGNESNHGFVAGVFDPIATWKVKPKDWDSHSFNTGRSSDPGGMAGPIGTGSMVFKSFNPTTSEVTFEKFENTKWDDSSKTWITDANNDHFLVKDGKLTNMPKFGRIIVTSTDDGFAAMKTGDVNIMDPEFYMSTMLEVLQNETTIQTLVTPEASWKAFYFNPKFEQDGIQHLNKKGVRHAISHIIPREDIIENVLHGLGLPAYTPIPRNSWAVIPEADLLSYKKTLTAIDGSTPEKNVKTAYDEYNITIALDWLASEGYNVEQWRNPTSSTTAHSSTAISSATDLLATVGWATLILLLELFSFFFLFFLLQRLKR